MKLTRNMLLVLDAIALKASLGEQLHRGVNGTTEALERRRLITFRHEPPDGWVLTSDGRVEHEAWMARRHLKVIHGGRARTSPRRGHLRLVRAA
jgi:hypothetical protein